MSMPDFQTLAVAIVVGIALGCVYALVAISFNLVLAACGVFNLTIGGVITAGVIISYELGTNSGWPPILVALTVMAFGGVVGWVAEILAVRRVLAMRPKDVAHDTMVSTLGLGMAMTALAAVLFGTNILPVDPYVSADPIVVADVPIRPVYLIMPVVVVAVAVAVELVLRRTEFGMVTRAVIASNEGASLMGISVNRVVQGAFIASGLMAGLGAFLIAPVTSASPFVGEQVMLFGFAAIAIGGFASFKGALFGGLLVGLVVGVTPAFLDEPSLRGPLVWALMVVVLFIRPAGLFGKGGQFGAAAVREV
jgi:branched-subunit amino acid ABC-type transport system permease component